MAETKPGKLFLVGGAADLVHERLVGQAGGAAAHILLVPHASSEPDASAEKARTSLARFSPAQVSVVRPDEALTIGPAVTAVYLLGGDQSRLVAALGDAGREQLQRFLAGGGLVAGTSAGAAAAATSMIAGGMSDGKISGDALLFAPGLSLLPKVVVDTHFGERGRFNRLIAAAGLIPDAIGIGLDEDTAVLVEDGSALVVGSGQVTFFVADTGTSPRLDGVRVFVLADGDRFDLSERRTAS